jgi:hypothetical protein
VTMMCGLQTKVTHMVGSGVPAQVQHVVCRCVLQLTALGQMMVADYACMTAEDVRVELHPVGRLGWLGGVSPRMNTVDAQGAGGVVQRPFLPDTQLLQQLDKQSGLAGALVAWSCRKIRADTRSVGGGVTLLTCTLATCIVSCLAQLP